MRTFIALLLLLFSITGTAQQHRGINFAYGLSSNNTHDNIFDCRDVVKSFGFYIATHHHNPLQLTVVGDDYSASSTWTREYKNASGENYKYYDGITIGVTKNISHEGQKFPVYLSAGLGNYRVHQIEKYTYLYYFNDGGYSQTRTEWREVSKTKKFVVECMASVVLINKRYFTFGITGGGNTATWFVGYFHAGFKL
ncbi:MAG: hypothetical protein ACOYMF_02715 [Bacteroidales bacterium]